MTGLAAPGARVFLSQLRQAGPQAALFVGARRSRSRLRAGARRRQHRASQRDRRPCARRRRNRGACRLRVAAARGEIRASARGSISCSKSPDRPPCYVEVKNVHLMRERALRRISGRGDGARRTASRRACRHGRGRPPRRDALSSSRSARPSASRSPATSTAATAKRSTGRGRPASRRSRIAARFRRRALRSPTQCRSWSDPISPPVAVIARLDRAIQ